MITTILKYTAGIFLYIFFCFVFVFNDAHNIGVDQDVLFWYFGLIIPVCFGIGLVMLKGWRSLFKFIGSFLLICIIIIILSVISISRNGLGSSYL